MNPLVKKILIISAIVSLVAGIIFIIEIISKLKLFNVLFNLEIPDILLLILIIGLIWWLISSYNKFKKGLENNIGEVRKDFENHEGGNVKFEKEMRENLAEIRKDLRKYFNQPKKNRMLRLNEEHYIILEALANSEDGCLLKQTLYLVFSKRKFKARKGRADFNLAISELKGSNLIEPKGDVLELLVDKSKEKTLCITDSGYACLRNRKD